jgi:hypothetical protein
MSKPTNQPPAALAAPTGSDFAMPSRRCSYRIETKGYGLAPWRTTTDGWTSNVGTKASAIRQAWEHWEQHQKPEWKEAK